MRTALSIIFSICIFGCKGQPTSLSPKKLNNNNTLLWQISGKALKKPSYLFGTFHLLCKDDINFSAQLRSAIQYVDEIYLELDMDDPSTLLSGLLYMNMKDGKKLKDFYTPSEYEKIEDFFNDTLHMPLVMFQKAKPYFLVALLYPKMMKCKTFSGIEEGILKLAKENKKEILGLETMEFQASVFDSIPYEWQAKELMKNIDSLDKYKNEFDTMMLAYKNQQLDVLEKLITKSEFGMDEFEDVLLNRRNANWVKKLGAVMKSKSLFVAVGAGHLLGEKGLIKLLRKEGYAVEPLIN